MSGCFITVEGIDGSGKTTQIELLVGHLAECGYPVLLTHEPGGTPLGDSLREMVLGYRFGTITAAAELFLYEASRAEHVAKVIRPAMISGQVVICDRFSDSTLVYQGYGRGLNQSALVTVDALATEGLKPDLTVVLDLPAEEAHRRLLDTRRAVDRMDAQGLEFLQRLREGYLALSGRESHRVVLLDASGPSPVVFESLRDVVMGFLRKREWVPE